MDKEEKCYPKYQYSYFIGPDQVVIRCEDSVEFKNAIDKVKQLIPPKVVEKPQETAVQGQENDTLCPLHNNTKMFGKEWNGTMLYSHIIKDVGFCNSKKITPFKK